MIWLWVLVSAFIISALMKHQNKVAARRRWEDHYRTWSDHGTTLVEYAIILSVVAVVALASINFMTRETKAEMEQEADCIGNPYQTHCSVGPDSDPTWVGYDE